MFELHSSCVSVYEVLPTPVVVLGVAEIWFSPLRQEPIREADWQPFMLYFMSISYGSRLHHRSFHFPILELACPPHVHTPIVHAGAAV